MGYKSLELIDRQVFWSNPGSGAISNIASGSVRYYVPGGVSLTATGASGWAKIPVPDGADICFIQNRANVTNWGSATAVSGGTRVSAIANLADVGVAAMDTPWAAGQDPELYWVAASQHMDGNAMAVRCLGPDQTTKLAVSDLTGIDQGMIPSFPATGGGLTFPTAPTQGGWAAQLGLWHFDVNSTSASGYDNELRVSGMKSFYLAISTFTTFTGATVANIRAQISLDLLFFREYTNVRQLRGSKGTTRGYGLLNIPATA